MTLRLVLEGGSHPQRRTEALLADGILVIGRGEECGWQLDDPQMFISRRHCVITGQGGQFSVTDESSGGLFLDAATVPLGRGAVAALRPGMQLRLGEFVIRVETAVDTVPAGPAVAPSPMFGDDFFTPRPEPPPPPRPADLPDPFDPPRGDAAAPEARQPQPAAAAFFDDPFSMDHGSRPVTPVPDPVPGAASSLAGASGSGVFDFGDFGLPPDLAPPAPIVPAPGATLPDSPPPPPPHPHPTGIADPFLVPPPPTAASAPPAVPAKAAAEPDAAVAAFLKGLGLAPPPGFRGTPAEMEALGRRYRAMAEGLVRLLRMRAQEKGAARVAQTVIGAANVNPLKFLAGSDEVVAALMAPRGPGYLDPDAAIAASIADLLDHHQRSWSGLQAALRRMVDRFDPALFETELEDVGMLRALVGGGRPARLWQLYSDRYRDIAKAAEDRFLGDVGADFRKAYETETGRVDDGTA